MLVRITVLFLNRTLVLFFPLDERFSCCIPLGSTLCLPHFSLLHAIYLSRAFLVVIKACFWLLGGDFCFD